MDSYTLFLSLNESQHCYPKTKEGKLKKDNVFKLNACLKVKHLGGNCMLYTVAI
jgi:hypothetical protein